MTRLARFVVALVAMLLAVAALAVASASAAPVFGGKASLNIVDPGDGGSGPMFTGACGWWNQGQYLAVLPFIDWWHAGERCKSDGYFHWETLAGSDWGIRRN